MELATKILGELACKSHVFEAQLMLLSLEPESFSATAAYTCSLSLFRGVIDLYENYLLARCSPPPQTWPRIAVKSIYRHNFRPVHL